MKITRKMPKSDLNPPSADYIETNVLKTKALQKTAPAGQAVPTFKPKTLLPFRASLG
jgi:hypothetical protein